MQKVSGNAAKSGIAAGDTVVYTSSFFGDELWPSDDVNFTKSAINAAPSPVCLVYVSLTGLTGRCLLVATQPGAQVAVENPMSDGASFAAYMLCQCWERCWCSGLPDSNL